MKVNVRVVGIQADRRGIADEMNIVPARGKLHAELGGNDARAAIGGIAGDADLHFVAFDALRFILLFASKGRARLIATPSASIAGCTFSRIYLRIYRSPAARKVRLLWRNASNSRSNGLRSRATWILWRRFRNVSRATLVLTATVEPISCSIPSTNSSIRDFHCESVIDACDLGAKGKQETICQQT